MNLDGLSLSPLVAELQAKLAGARVDKIFQPDRYTIIIWLRQPGETFALLLSANPEYPRIHLAENLPGNPLTAPVFSMLLRKHLEDGRLARIEQHSLDRVVRLHFDVRGDRGLIITKQLIIEIMGKHSNIILVQDDVIIDSVRRVSQHMSRFRQVLPGRDYALPPDQARANPLVMTTADFAARIRQHPKEQAGLSKAIIDSAVGVGPLTAREIAWRSGLAADLAVSTLDDADSAALAQSIAEIISPLAEGTVQPTVVVGSDGRRLLGIAAFRLEHLSSGDVLDFPTMSKAVEFAASFQGKPENPEKTILQKLVAGEMAKLARKETVLTEEIATADQADTLRCHADILMSHLHSVEPGASEVILPNLYAPDPDRESVTIILDPLLSILVNAQHYYAKYNKMKRAQESLALQIKECQKEFGYLDSIAVALENATTADEIIEIRQELVQAGYLKDSSKRRPPPPTAVQTARTPDGLIVLVGKNNRQNDLVTFKQGQPDDLWFHTKDIPGSHVILRSSGFDPSIEALTAAAGLAAYYSKARQSASVPVDYTRRRHVKKPAGAKPGFVIYDHQKTIYVTPDEELVKKLMLPVEKKKDKI
ncbi:MAG: NFACT RNA binding domain-containing protein [Negativicutes bacterium]|nr:NFACT RNA binding domain-containing protein [Negativicutes bacterium]